VTPAKKPNQTEQPPVDDEIEFEPEDDGTQGGQKGYRRIKIVREQHYGYKPRIVPPWASRLKNRYIEGTEYFVPRLESEVSGEESSYTTADLTINGGHHVILTHIKRDVSEVPDEQGGADESGNKNADETKPKRGRGKKNQETTVLTEGNVPANEEIVEVTENDANSLYTYAVVDGEVQDTIVVDDDAQGEPPVQYDLYQQQVYPEDVTSMYLVGSELVKHSWESNEEISSFFAANPHLNYPVDVREIAMMAKNASPEINYQLITGLAGMVSCLKKEISSLKCEMSGLRELVSNKQDLGNTRRRFSTMNDVRHNWKIQAMPPLREVDLVNIARTIDYTRGAKKQLSNKDGITRFVKTCLELLIPEEYAKYYTVRDRSHRKNGLKDIGDHAKEQITGCVLDLLGLYDIDELDDEGRADRATFTNIVSHAMRMAL